MAIRPELVFCADGSPDFARVAIECGWKYGARLPSTVYHPVHFADQDWKRPDLTRYRAAVALHRPHVATVLDWELDEQRDEVMSWCEEIAPMVSRLIVIPKVSGTIDLIPMKFGDAEVVLGFSVPTSYGGTTVPTWEFAGRPVHLLGGSPQAQRKLMGYLRVVSLDGNMAGQQARKGRLWTRVSGPKGHWQQANVMGIEQDRPALECFRRSMIAIGEFFQGKTA